MAQPSMQHSFSAGEWSPSLNARVDQAKYHSAAALLRNFFVDYRGGASSCPGTKYCLQAKSLGAWLVPFQASFTVSYMMEFGQNYIRFYQNGSPVLEAAETIVGLTNANPGVFNVVAHGYSVNDWVYLLVTGTSGLNGKYFIVSTTPDANHFTLTDLYGTVVNTTASGAFVSGTSQRIYTLPTPYNTADLPTLKYAQSAQILILCNTNYVPYVLTFISSTNWTLLPIVFGSTIQAPTGAAAVTTLGGGGGYNYAYVVTAIDVNGQESAASAVALLTNKNQWGAAAKTSTITWNSVPGAIFYNVYAAVFLDTVATPTGAAFGFIGYCTSTTFNDTAGIIPDFLITPPVPQNPFQGAGVDHVTVTAPGVYVAVPTVTFAAAPTGGQTATGSVVLQLQSFVFFSSGAGHTVGQAISFANGIVLIVATVDGSGHVTAFQPITYPGSNRGSVTSGTPPVALTSTGSGVIVINTLVWGVGIVNIIQAGSGYTSAPAVTFSAGAAAGTAVLAATSAGNPAVPAFYQQRLVLAGSAAAPQTFNMSRPGTPYNFDKSNPTQGDDAISGSIVSKQLNAIKSMVAMPGGLIMMSNSAAWQINGGTAGASITPADANAQAQSYVGSSDLPLIVSNYDVLFVQAKGSIVRDMSYNFYANVWTGTDVSILSSHLFYSFSLLQWAWAEEPFKVVWAVRSDGQLLSLTYLKEQELIGWAHRDTLGLFTSVGTITESTSTAGNVDAIYVIVQRTVNGQILQYVERMAERAFPYGMEDAWCVDAALQSAGQTPAAGLTASQSGTGTGVTFTADAAVFTAPMVGWVIRMGGGIATITGFTSTTVVTGTITQAISAVLQDSGGVPLIAASGAWTLWTPATTWSGLDHLNGQSVVGLLDGVPVGPLTVSNGSVTTASGTKAIFGLSYTPQLQTLALDLGEPTIQGKRKKIVAVTARVKDALGLSIGQSFSSLVPMKDLVLNNVGSATNALVTNLQTADARTIVDPLWQVPGQYCFQQSYPLPVSILGVIHETTVGDTIK